MFLTVFFIAVGLAMDAFAVSVSSGCAARSMRVQHALRMALFFGAFQAGMPVIGWLSGLSVRAYIAHIDHWIAFVLLAAIGIKMVYEARILRDAETTARVSRPVREAWPGADELDMMTVPAPHSFYTLLMLSLATSIDALVVGMSLSLLDIGIIMPALVIGAVTFLLSLLGVYLGKSVGHLFENKIEIFGGLVLVAIGAKILIAGLCE